MRFISSHRGLELGLRNPKITSFTQTGDPIYDGSYLKAEFIPGGVSVVEAEVASKALIFKGMYEGEDPVERLSWFDTKLAQEHYGWTDEEREFAEQRLLGHESLGVDFMVVEEPKAAIPWASYDTTDVEDIVGLIRATGTDSASVLRYERENQNRQAVIDAIESDEDDAPKKDKSVVVNA